MILVGADNEAGQIFFLGNPLGVTVTENHIAAGGPVVGARIGVIVIFAGWIQGASQNGKMAIPREVRSG